MYIYLFIILSIINVFKNEMKLMLNIGFDGVFCG